MSSGNYEQFSLEEGDQEELINRAYALASVAYRCSGDKGALKIAMDAEEDSSIDAIKNAIIKLRKVFLTATKGEAKGMSGDDWLDAYIAIFGDSPYRIESDYVPEDDQMKDVLRTCIASGTKIDISVPDGMNG